MPLPFPRARPTGKNVEDQLRAIEDLAIDVGFDLSKLCRAQFVVEDDEIDSSGFARACQRLDLTAAQKRCWIGGVTLLKHPKRNGRAGGNREAFALFRKGEP